MATIPRLSDYDISEKTGFNLENPETKLPEEFKPWTRLAEELVDLVERKKLRAKVDKMPLLDHTVLSTDRQRRLAHMYLTFIGNAYVWQDGDKNVPKSVPKQLAVPWCALSDLVGLPPVITLSTVALSNYVVIDQELPLTIENMSTICNFPGGDSCKNFCLLATQIELDALPGIKAILEGMHGVETQDVHRVINSLNNINEALEDIMKSMKVLHKLVDPGVFYNTLRPFLSGWGGEGSPLSDGLIYEGVSEEPRKLKGGSQAQSSSIQCFDAALGLVHLPAEQKYLDEIREHMPRKHAEFIAALWKAPSIKDFVANNGDPELRKTYEDCIKTFRKLRTRHLALATRSDL